MIKTECKRRIVDSGIEPPKSVKEKLKELDKNLILIFDKDTNTWQIYRIKYRAATESDDTIHWQISAPTKGLQITTGIVDWLKKYDTSKAGTFDSEDLKKKWLEQFKNHQYEDSRRKEKQKKEQHYMNNWGILNRLKGLREQISVPVQVAWNKKTGKKLYAVKKKQLLLGETGG